jgi:hypothetical protein
MRTDISPVALAFRRSLVMSVKRVTPERGEGREILKIDFFFQY